MFTGGFIEERSGDGLAADFGSKFKIDCSGEGLATDLIGLMDNGVSMGKVGSLISITSKS